MKTMLRNQKSLDRYDVLEAKDFSALLTKGNDDKLKDPVKGK